MPFVLVRYHSFAAVAHPNSKSRPHRRSKILSDRSFTPLIAANLPSNCLRRCIFCSIVAVAAANFGRRYEQKVEFREFQECEFQNNASRAKTHMRRSDTEVGMVAAYHLCGRYGHIMLLGRGSASVENGKIKNFPSDVSAFFFWFPPVEMTCLVPVSTTESRSASPAVSAGQSWELGRRGLLPTCT